MAKQLHRKFPNEQVKSLLKRYLSKEIKIGYILEILSIKRSRFFELLKEYREAPESFSISYKRQKCTRRINQKIEENIIKELQGEIPSLRFHDALEGKKSLFRKFSVPPPYQSSKDIFCLRAERVVNPYRKISFNNLEFRISGVPIRGTVQLRIIPDKVSGMAEIRFWYDNKLVGIEKVKNEDLKLVHF